MEELRNYKFYSRRFHKIQTKLNGLQPLVLRLYQRKFIDFWESIHGPVRIIALKPRQAGFSTIVGSKFVHRACTESHFKMIMLADKSGRTEEVASIYKTYVDNLEPELTPMISANNTEKIRFDNPKERERKAHPGLGSEIAFETGNDPNAGRSGTRKGAHITEVAFIRYMKEIDDGIQNSIPLADSTWIVKESTANGRAGIGKSFFDLWQAAKRGDSIYKPFFVAWFEVDDYQVQPPRDFTPTKYEREVLRQFPSVTEANLMWRRLKLSEYLDDDQEAILGPEERFKQDFPLSDEEAFLSTGSPVFPVEIVTKIVNALTGSTPADVKDRLGIKSYILKNYWDGLRIYAPPRDHKQYFIGADVSEGLAIGDASSVYVMDEEYNQVARWHGKIDPDLLGHLLISLGELYNKALINPENNNMGHTTVTTLRNEGYSRLYKQKIEDKVSREVRTQFGWKTTKKSKDEMLNESIGRLRDGDCKILDIRLAQEMGDVARGENGIVELNGKDRVVAFCLACMARKQYFVQPREKAKKPRAVYGTGEEITRAWEQKNRRRKDDLFG